MLLTQVGVDLRTEKGDHECPLSQPTEPTAESALSQFELFFNLTSQLLDCHPILSFLHITSFQMSTMAEMPFNMNDSSLLLFFIGAVSLTLTYLVMQKMFGHDPREPPLARQSVPLVGHMIGLSRSKFNYYVEIRYAVNTSQP